MNHEIHEIILNQACREIEQFAEKTKKGQGLTAQDFEMLDKLYHLKKDMLTCKAMEDAEIYEEGMSGRRGRAANGQYTSGQDNMSSRMSYDEGYSQGYADAQSRGRYQDGAQSGGHWTVPYYGPRNW